MGWPKNLCSSTKEAGKRELLVIHAIYRPPTTSPQLKQHLAPVQSDW